MFCKCVTHNKVCTYPIHINATFLKICIFSCMVICGDLEGQGHTDIMVV